VTERRLVFGSAAADYAAHRPDYPGSAIAWALEHTPGPRVLDLAAGTGKLTAGLLDRDVVAVEPDPGMLEVLRADLPQVEALLGTAEDIPLPDASVDAVLVGQAVHWFDPARAWPEIARVLRPACSPASGTATTPASTGSAGCTRRSRTASPCRRAATRPSWSRGVRSAAWGGRPSPSPARRPSTAWSRP
jgi:SAM-dependent methyltransferase